jgi:Sec7-like guanine-nucleotide exchange factor
MFTRKIESINKYFFKDLVLRCIAQLVDSNQANIRSGWKNVFGVLGIAAGSNREAIVEVSIFFELFSRFYRYLYFFKVIF